MDQGFCKTILVFVSILPSCKSVPYLSLPFWGKRPVFPHVTSSTLLFESMKYEMYVMMINFLEFGCNSLFPQIQANTDSFDNGLHHLVDF